MKYKLTVTDDFEDNGGDPINRETFLFKSKEEAEMKAHEQLQYVVDENGVTRYVELYEYQDDEDEDYHSGNLILSDSCISEPLPDEGVIVFFKHRTYMGYCYEITGIQLVDGSGFKTREHLPYSYDSTSATWARVLDNVSDLQDAYVNNRCTPFDKLQKGVRITEEFLAENGYKDEYGEEEE